MNPTETVRLEIKVARAQLAIALRHQTSMDAVRAIDAALDCLDRADAAITIPPSP